MGVETVSEILGDEVPGPQCADENRVMPAFTDKTNIVRKRRRYPQFNAAARRFPAQEVGLHLDVAIAQQNDIEGLAAGAEIVQAVGSADRPIGRRAFFHRAPVALQHLGRIPPMPGRKFGADRGQLFLGGLFSQDLPGQQIQYRALDHITQIRQLVPRVRKQRHHRLAILGNAARLGKIIQKSADLAIGGQAHLADRVHDQGAVLPNRQLMDKARAAQDHASL